MNFPEGITYKYRYTTGCDFIPAGHSVSGSMSYAYAGSKNYIIEIPYDTSNVSDMSYMFYSCSNLTSIPQLDTSNVTNMDNMFYFNQNLETIPLIDTSNVTNMNNMFYYCRNLTSIPQLDTSNVATLNNMCGGCSKLTSIPQLDTSNVTNMDNMCGDCSSLTSVPQLDCSKVTNIGMFGYSGCKSLVNLGGFKNLGMQKSVSSTTGNYFLGASSKLTHESIMNVIKNLYDRKTAGYSVLTLKLHADTLALLSDEEKAIATNKGWTLA